MLSFISCFCPRSLSCLTCTCMYDDLADSFAISSNNKFILIIRVKESVIKNYNSSHKHYFIQYSIPINHGDHLFLQNLMITTI